MESPSYPDNVSDKGWNVIKTHLEVRSPLGVLSAVLSMGIYTILVTLVAPIALAITGAFTQVASWFTGAIPILTAAISAVLLGLKIAFDKISSTITQYQHCVKPKPSSMSKTVGFYNSDNFKFYLFFLLFS